MDHQEAKGWAGIALAFLGPIGAWIGKLLLDRRKRHRELQDLSLAEKRDANAQLILGLQEDKARLLQELEQSQALTTRLYERLTSTEARLAAQNQLVAILLEERQAAKTLSERAPQLESAKTAASATKTKPLPYTSRFPRPPRLPQK